MLPRASVHPPRRAAPPAWRCCRAHSVRCVGYSPVGSRTLFAPHTRRMYRPPRESDRQSFASDCGALSRTRSLLVIRSRLGAQRCQLRSRNCRGRRGRGLGNGATVKVRPSLSFAHFTSTSCARIPLCRLQQHLSVLPTESSGIGENESERVDNARAASTEPSSDARDFVRKSSLLKVLECQPQTGSAREGHLGKSGKR